LIFLIWFSSLFFMLPIAVLSKLIPISQGNQVICTPERTENNCFSILTFRPQKVSRGLAKRTFPLRKNLQHLPGHDSACYSAGCLGSRIFHDISNPLAIHGLRKAAG
jgi:hypothetical protein